ncbi:dihydrolipoamide acetyltransferase family protein [Agromyces aerolatus]|uniref:dihydrolipoamide acetyltransferase family protein n=1 Tax=Agromyces sp. LY-1074 TaxID=3074080 RepID=UPI002860051E|nr:MULTISPECIES: dihydrolipoamide acetyltransferase family protein [unclassified Agromyces]MDR5701877.1 dihydrolipoamide acetyltransferase family protein [Agromyces sp. LY-1074]MDR5708109.1 dihydrolipoamide acetyltransferase family protein [Agromyces sp. LY-1358]
MSEPQVFVLPDVGEGLTEAEIVSWRVKVGDTVDVNDALCEVETAKSVVELPSPFAGVVVERHGDEGETLAVGVPLISIAQAVPASAEAAVPTEASAAPREEESDAAPLVLVGSGPTEAGGRRIRLRRPAGPDFERPRTGTSTSPDDVRIPVKGVRKATAEAMVRSATTAPHASMWLDVDVTRTTELIGRLKADREWAGVRISPLLLIARMVALAVARYPEINASWDDESREIVLHRTLNLGIAAATPRGLLVPNLKDAGSLSLRELADALAELVDRARAGTLTPAELSGGTLTLTNVGVFGMEGATPILNPPEAAILALGAIAPRPWVVDGELRVRDVMTLSISIDHRLVDGELGASVLQHIARLLNDPGRALLG